MSSMNTNLKLALALTLTLLGPAACNTQKVEQAEEDEASESQSESSPNRDNRNSQTGDAAFIKIFPDGDIVPTRGESATVTAPGVPTPPAAPAEIAAPPAPGLDIPAALPSEIPAAAPSINIEETITPALSQPVVSLPAEETSTPAPVVETQPAVEPIVVSEPAATPAPVVVNEPAPTPIAVNEPAPTPAPVAVSEPAPTPIAVNEPAPTPAPVVVSEPAPSPVVVNEPAPTPAPAQAAAEENILKDADDHSRPVLALNESTASQIISVLPKEQKSIVAIGKHADFVPGPYMILAKWTNDSKKVKVNVTSDEAKEKNCALNESATQGEWKTLGVFYLTKNAKVVITNGKNSNYAVKNELLLKPVIAENVSTPSKFKCLGGQIDGQGLVGFP